MAGDISNELIYELLKSVQGQVSKLQADTLEIKERLGTLEMQYASLSRRVDRIDERLDRVETRLGLVEG